MKRQFLNYLIVIPAAALLLGALAGCSSDDETATGTASLTFSSTNAAHMVALTPMQKLWRAIGPGTAHAVTGLADSAGNPVVLTDFQISIREVRLKQESQDAAGLAEDSVDFDGPFAVDLINDAGDPIAQTIGDTPVPAGSYDGIRFVMHKDAAAAAPLTDRSIYIAGTVDRGSGVESFVMWHDTGENFDFFGPNPIVVDLGVINDLVVDFKLVSVIAAIDFGAAGADLTDINPASADAANNAIADLLKDGIKAAADFGEDEDGDGILDESEDVD